MRSRLIGFLVAALLCNAGLPAFAERPLAILMPGTLRGALQRDFLIRNVQKFRKAGFETTLSVEPDQVVRIAAEQPPSRKVVLVAMSRGVERAAEAFTRGLAVDRAVFVSGKGRLALKRLRRVRNLPPILWVHHEQDACKGTPVKDARRFARRIPGVRLVVFDFPGTPKGDGCASLHAHGFYGKDDAPMREILAFISRG